MLSRAQRFVGCIHAFVGEAAAAAAARISVDNQNMWLHPNLLPLWSEGAVDEEKASKGQLRDTLSGAVCVPVCVHTPLSVPECMCVYVCVCFSSRV